MGPQWNAARSTHHRIAWLARESSKPGRNSIERWTVQASPTWSAEHLEDDPDRVQAKLLKAFSEVTGIRAAPTHAEVHRWRYAQTTKPLGQSYLWDEGHRVLAPVATGAWATDSKTPSFPGWNWHSPRRAQGVTLAGLRHRLRARCMQARWWLRWPVGWMHAHGTAASAAAGWCVSKMWTPPAACPARPNASWRSSPRAAWCPTSRH